MNTDLEADLAEVFESVGSSMSPAPDLAVRVRARVRSRRRRARWVGGVAVLLVVAIGVAVLGGGGASSPGKVAKLPTPRFHVSAVNVEAMAVRGDRLYVAMNAYPAGLLTAYDRRAGSEMRSGSFPAGPSSVAVAADGTVWVAFSPSNASRRAGVAEFSPDLRDRSMLLTDDRYLQTATFDVLPTGHGRALLATARGLVAVRLPRLGSGRTVHASRRNAVLTAVPGNHRGTPTRLAGLSDGNVATLLSAAGGRSEVVVRTSAASFEGTEITLAASPEGLWVTTGVGAHARLQRLSNGLEPLPTGAVVQAVSLPGGTDRVWTSDRTVWVATHGHRIALTCFAFTGPEHRPSATVTLPEADSIEASDPVISGDLTIVPSGTAIYVASPFGITGYPVPAACRS